MPASTRVLLAGATGLVGRHCLRYLLQDPAFERVVVPTRRALPSEIYSGTNVAKLEEHVVDFTRLYEKHEMMRVDKVICALGTTIKKAGSKEAFREVDYGYPAALADLAKEHGARQYILVSAIGADSESMFFYNRVKGDVEDRLRSIGFAGLTIVRPSLLLGDRDEFRLGEEIAKRSTFLIPEKYKPVPARHVAAVLADAAKSNREGVEVVESQQIRWRARSLLEDESQS